MIFCQKIIEPPLKFLKLPEKSTKVLVVKNGKVYSCAYPVNYNENKSNLLIKALISRSLSMSYSEERIVYINMFSEISIILIKAICLL